MSAQALLHSTYKTFQRTVNACCYALNVAVALAARLCVRKHADSLNALRWSRNYRQRADADFARHSILYVFCILQIVNIEPSCCCCDSIANALLL
eukprot:6647-Heterococcus_DN1.PRE.3